MQLSRRDSLLIFGLALIPLPVFAKAPKTLAAWVDLAKLVEDVAEGLDKLSEAVDKITVDSVHLYDWFRGRSAREGLIQLSNRLSTMIANQAGFEHSLDQYGDLWRSAHRESRKNARAMEMQLRGQWNKVITKIREVTAELKSMLSDFNAVDNEVVLSDEYGSLKEALAQKVGILDRIEFTDPPGNPGEMKRLVDQEEAFLRWQSNARHAVDSINRAIDRIPH